MPRIRDHDQRYCARCQFWLAFNRAAGAVTRIVASVLILAIVLGGLAVGGFLGFLYVSSNLDKLETLAEKLGPTVGYLFLIAMGLIIAF